jgi:hypothetical protein
MKALIKKERNNIVQIEKRVERGLSGNLERG